MIVTRVGWKAVQSLLMLAAAVVLMTGCKEQQTRSPVPIPNLPVEGTLMVRAAYVFNSRFPPINDEERKLILKSASETVKAHFGKDIAFDQPSIIPIEQVFAPLSAAEQEVLQTAIFDYGRGGNRAHLKKQFESDIRRTGDDLGAMIDYARPYLVRDLQTMTYAGLTDALIETQLTRIAELARQPAPDGSPILNGAFYSEWVYWDVLYHLALPYEVIITNQLIASVEYAGNSVHSAIRGGITNGVTEPNRHSALGSTAVVSVYPFIGDDPVIRHLRGDDTYSRPEAMRLAGVLLAHELGHQLFHLGHPYGRVACVMAPTPLLHFREWANQLSPKDCPISDAPGMKPGSWKMLQPNE